MATRVVLDTAAIRGLIHGDAAAKPLEELQSHRSGLSIAIANNAVPELVLALHQGRLHWDKWESRVPLLNRILDPSSPVFPDDAELNRVATGPVTERRYAISRAEHRRAIWELLRRARGPQDLEQGSSFVGSDGVEYRIESSRALAERLADEHRAKWIEMIRTVQDQIVGYHPTQEHIAELQFAAFFGGHPDEQALRQRHDGYIRSFARFIALALRRKTPYSATSDGRRGDSFDLELLTVLAAPGLVCTLDGRLARHVAASRSPQVVQLLSPRGLLDEARAGTLEQTVKFAISRGA